MGTITSGIREQFPDVRPALLDELCRDAGTDRQVAENNISEVPLRVIRETLKALAQREDTRELVWKWISDKPTDYVQGVDPVTASVALAGIYLVLTMNFTFKYRNGPKGREISLDLRRKNDVPRGFIMSIIDWLRGSCE